MADRQTSSNRAPNEPRAASVEAAANSSQTIQTIHLSQYVTSLDEIRPVATARPTINRQTHHPQVLVRVTHTAINHVDLLYAHGVHQNNKSGLFKPPFTLGLEFSGVVLSSTSINFSRGDRVWGGGLGSHAEEIVVAESNVRRVPRGWSLRGIAALGAATLPVSYGGLVQIAGIKAGETVIVHAAAGGLGVYALQIAKKMGCKVIGTVGSAEKQRVVEDLLRRNGVVEPGEGVVRYDLVGWEDQVKQICRKSGKDGVDVVFDTVGLVGQSIRCTTFNGRIVIIGFAGRTGTSAEKVKELETVAVNRLLMKQIKLLGYRYGETGRRMPQENEKLWEALTAMLQDEGIKPIIYNTYEGLEHVADAMKDLADRKVFGKAVVEIVSEDDALMDVLGRSTARL